MQGIDGIDKAIRTPPGVCHKIHRQQIQPVAAPKASAKRRECLSLDGGQSNLWNILFLQEHE